MSFANTYPECILSDIKEMVVHPDPKHIRVVPDTDGKRSSSLARTVVRHESTEEIPRLHTVKEANGEATEGKVIRQCWYPKRRPSNEVSALIVYAVSADDVHAIVLDVQAVQALDVVPAVLERDARYRT